ncbi:MAG: TonB-dependent receptor [Tannerellaceae bacterium]|nr:TonB-dependent receptor [Tannerellaceae bacterium]
MAAGQGGVRPMTQGDTLKVSEDAYGMRLNPSLNSVFIDGSEHAYVSRYKPMDFYNNGFNTANTVSITGGSSKAAFRFSYGNEYYKDITPEFNYMKHNLLMRMNGELTSRLSYDFKINFNTTNADQRPQSGHGQFNPATVLPILPADTDLEKLKAMGRDISTGGLINTWDGALNPYYILYQYKSNDQTFAGNGLAMISYKILKNLKVTYRQGIELSDFNTHRTVPQGSGFRMNMAGRTDYMTQGGIFKNNTKFILLNTDVFGEYNLQAGKFSFDVMAGFNHWSQKRRDMGLEAADFIAPDLYVPSNAQNQSASYSLNNKKMLGMYGSVDIGYDRFLYLTLTGRNDWSSTLPRENNSYFYPSVGGSFIFSEIIKLPEWFNFGKIRASWAEVGSDTSPYQLNMYYGLFAGGYPTDHGTMVYPGDISSTVLPPLNLKPMSTRSTEVGLDVRFFNSRLGLDIAYYNNTTKDQILQAPIPPRSSGFESSLMNAGSVKNHGIEIILTGTPVQTKNISWDISVNIAHNRSKVKKLHDELKSIQMYFCEAMSVMAIEGEPYGIMYGSDYLYNADGSIQVDEEGYPLYDTSYNTYLGSAIPKVIWGMTNRIGYKDFYLNFTIDSRLGHKYYSKTSRWMYEYGTHINTIPGRDEYYADGTGLDPLKLGKIQSVVAAQNLYNGGYIRMKEIAIGYKLPQSFISKLMLKQANVSMVLSNPFFIWRGSDFTDPTFSLNSTVGMEGIENGGEPAIRSLGVNLNLKF